MKTANLVVSIIFSVILGLVLLYAEDVDTVIGVLMFSAPVVVNWMSWAKWPKK